MAYVGPGDLTTYAAWYGFRGYSAAAAALGTTKAVKVRRDSDNTTQDILIKTTGDLDVAAATTFAAGANLFLDTLYDQTGNALHVTQATTGDQPAFVFSALGSLPAYIFSNAGNVAWLAKTSGVTLNSSGSPITFVSFSINTLSGFNWIGGSLNAGADVDILYNGTTAMFLRGGGGNFSVPTIASGWSSIFGTVDSSAGGVWQNGTLAQAGNLTPGAGVQILLGAANPAGAGDGRGVSQAEFGIILAVPTGTVITLTSLNQNAYWLAAPPSGKLFLSAPMSGLGAGGPFFRDRLA